MKIFVSYSRRDAGDFANQINRNLSIFKHDIFTDVDDIKAGEIWSNTIEENISNCDIFVVIVTHGALQSPHVENEILQAQRENKKIIPCFFRDIHPNIIKWGLEKIQGVEFSDKYELARDLYSKIDTENKRGYPDSQDDQDGEKTALHYILTRKISKRIISITAISIIAVTAVVIGIVVFQPQPLPTPNGNGTNGAKDAVVVTPPEQNVDTLFSSALSYYQLHQYPDAVDSFNKVLQIEPNNVTAQFLKGSSLFHEGNYSDAVDSFNKVLQIEPNNVTAQYFKSLSQYEAANYSNAHESFNKILQIQSNNTDALYYDGLSLYNLKKYNEAEDQFDRLLAVEPTTIDALLYKGLSLYNLERYNEAVAYYDSILEIDPNNINATKEKEKIQQIQQNQSNININN